MTALGARGQQINVLLLDGGGIRGISTLLILNQLMQYVTFFAKAKGYEGEQLRPDQVFKLVVGTSTGGLISIMVGKLGMRPQDCIQAYNNFAHKIFGKRKWRSRVTSGVWWSTKYFAVTLKECVETLLVQQHKNKNLEMFCEDGSDPTACAVVCREHEDDSARSDLIDSAALICSIPCQERIPCRVFEAVRATSAAVTYFKPQKITVDGQNKLFEDGGWECNNPSLDAWDHFHGQAVQDALGQHNLDIARARFVNIGTGTRPKGVAGRRRDALQSHLPPALLNLGHLKWRLVKCATASERTARAMRLIAKRHDNTIEFERFSATTGVHMFEMDACGDMDEIHRLTVSYLQKEAVEIDMRRVAEQIAADYMVPMQ